MTPWTAAERAKALDLIREGKAWREIAREMGRTKSSIAGLAHRLRRQGLLSEGDPNQMRRGPAVVPGEAKPRVRQRRAPAEVEEPEPQELPEPQGRPNFPGCQWIEGEPSASDDCKCGAPAVAGSSYCPRHRKRAVARVVGLATTHVPPSPKSSSASR